MVAYYTLYVKPKKYNKQPLVSFLGLTYKANSRDFRESPAIRIIERIKIKFSNFYIVDPFVSKIMNIETKKLDYALKKSDIIFMLVKHKHFENIKSKIKNKIIFVDYTNN